MSDYPSLKREKAQLQGQVRLLKTQLEEAQEENRLLHAGEGRLLFTRLLGVLKACYFPTLPTSP